jgi:hypothetical protein
MVPPPACRCQPGCHAAVTVSVIHRRQRRTEELAAFAEHADRFVGASTIRDKPVMGSWFMPAALPGRGIGA